MYYVVLDYGIAHSPHGPCPLDPCAIADGKFVAQEYLANTADSTYHQPVPTSPYAFLPSAADRVPASTSQTLGYTDGLFIPGGQGQTLSVTSNNGVSCLYNQLLFLQRNFKTMLCYQRYNCIVQFHGSKN